MMISDGEDDRFTDDEDEDEDTHPGSTDAVTGSPPPSLGSSEASQDLNDTDNSINALNAKKNAKQIRDQMEKPILSRQATLPALTDTADSQDLENLSNLEIAELKKQPLHQTLDPRVDGKCGKHAGRLSSASASVEASSELASMDKEESDEDPAAKCARLEAELQELRRRQTAKILGLNLTWIYIFFLIFDIHILMK